MNAWKDQSLGGKLKLIAFIPAPVLFLVVLAEGYTFMTTRSGRLGLERARHRPSLLLDEDRPLALVAAQHHAAQLTDATMPSPSPRRRLVWPIALLLSAAAVLAHEYVARVDQSNPAARLELHRQIIDGSAVAPYRYRVLVPFLCEAARRLTAGVMAPEKGFSTAYGIYDFAALALLMVALYRYLRLWFTESQALVGVLFAGSTITIAFRDHYFQPWSLLEAALLAAGLWAIHQRRHALIAAIVVLATLNRETGCFIALAFVCANWAAIMSSIRSFRPRLEAVLALTYGGLWLATYVGIRVARGDTTNIHSLATLFSGNTKPENLQQALINTALFLGAFWIFAVAGWRRSPSFVRRVSFVIPCYLLTVAAWGVWTEVRLLISLYALVLPMGLSWAYARKSEALGTNEEHGRT